MHSAGKAYPVCSNDVLWHTFCPVKTIISISQSALGHEGPGVAVRGEGYNSSVKQTKPLQKC